MTDDPRLTEALREKARSFSPHPAGIQDVVDRAHAIRRRRRTTAGLVAAAAVLAVAVPTAVVLRPEPQIVVPAGPTPTATATPSRTPSATPSTGPTTGAPPGPSLTEISRAGDLAGSYLRDDVIHWQGGGTTRLPGGRTWISFASYHGGVLATSTDGATSTVTQFDNTGKVVASHPGSGPVVSPDGMQTAWWWQDLAGGGGHVYTGVSSGMGNGESRDPTPPGVPIVPVGFLPSTGPVYDAGPGTVRILGSPQPDATVPHLYAASGVAANGLVAGRIDATGSQGVVDTGTGAVRWTAPSGWVLDRFSNDGTDVAGQHQAPDGSVDAVAIFDARSGQRVQSYTPQAPLALAGPVAWQPDGTAVVMEVFDTQRQAWALLRLTTSGTVDRVSDVVPGREAAPPFSFAAQP